MQCFTVVLACVGEAQCLQSAKQQNRSRHSHILGYRPLLRLFRLSSRRSAALPNSSSRLPVSSKMAITLETVAMLMDPASTEASRRQTSRNNCILQHKRASGLQNASVMTISRHCFPGALLLFAVIQGTTSRRPPRGPQDADNCN